MAKKLNQSEKIRICNDIQSGLYKDSFICEKYGISKGSLHRLKMKRKEILCQGCSTSNETTGYQLNTEVYEVFRSLRCKGFPVN